MEPACRKDKPKLNSTPTRGDRAKQKSAQQELKQRQRAEVTDITVMLVLISGVTGGLCLFVLIEIV